MTKRNIKNGHWGWYQKGAMQRIEKLPFGQQGPCKLIYLALCSMSAKQKNNPMITCYKFDLARYASVSERTLYRYLPILKKTKIIDVSPAVRVADGKYAKSQITLLSSPPIHLPLGVTESHMAGDNENEYRQSISQKPSATSRDTESDIPNKGIKGRKNFPKGKNSSAPEPSMYKEIKYEDL